MCYLPRHSYLVVGSDRHLYVTVHHFPPTQPTHPTGCFSLSPTPKRLNRQSGLNAAQRTHTDCKVLIPIKIGFWDCRQRHLCWRKKFYNDIFFCNKIIQHRNLKTFLAANQSPFAWQIAQWTVKYWPACVLATPVHPHQSKSWPTSKLHNLPLHRSLATSDRAVGWKKARQHF